MIKVSDKIVQILQTNGVKYIFGIPTGTTSAIYDSLNDTSIESIVTRNEATATYASVKYAELSKKLAVCVMGTNVGIGNAINGIGDALTNKVPVLIISGLPRKNYLGKGAIQELDTTQVTKPITKYSKLILEAKDIEKELKEAIKIACTEPCGPVHLAIPISVQSELIEDTKENMKVIINKKIYNQRNIKEALSLINKSQTGVIFVGRGARGLTEEIKALSEKLQWAVMTTAEGKGIIDTDFEYNMGVYGFCSSDFATKYIDDTKLDCLLVLGSSLGQLATRDYKENLVKDKKVIHIDFDEKELNKNFNVDIPVYSDLKTALDIFNKDIKQKNNNFKREYINEPYVKNHTGLSLRLFFEELVNIVPENTRFISDIGQFMNFTIKYLPIKKDMDYQLSLHYGAMGHGVCGVIGSELADSSKLNCVLVGDGGFLMNGIDVITAKEYKLPIVYFVVNNSMYSLVKHGGKFIFGREHKGILEIQRFSISEMTKAMNIKSIQIKENSEINILKDVLKDLKEPLVVEIITDGSEQVLDMDRLGNLTK